MFHWNSKAQHSDPVVRRSSLTIREALEAARQAGMQTPDTGLFERWVRAKGLSSRGSILVARMRQEYEQAFEERFNGQIAFSRHADKISPRSGAINSGESVAHSDGNCSQVLKGGAHTKEQEWVNHAAGAVSNTFPAVPVIVRQPADPKKLNRLFLERQKGGDAKRTQDTPIQDIGTHISGLRLERQKGGDAKRTTHTMGKRNEGGSNPPSIPSPDSIEALYVSGKASSLKEALAILGGK